MNRSRSPDPATGRADRTTALLVALALALLFLGGAWWSTRMLEEAVARGELVLAAHVASTRSAPVGHGAAASGSGTVDVLASPTAELEPWLTYMARKASGWDSDWRTARDPRGGEWLLARHVADDRSVTVTARPKSDALSAVGPIRAAGMAMAATSAGAVLLLWRRRERSLHFRMRSLIEAGQDLRWRGDIRSSHLSALDDVAFREDQFGELAQALVGAEEQIRERLSRLNALLEASRSVGSSLLERSVLSRILEQIQEVFGVERCAVLTLDERAGAFRIEASRGMSAEFVEDLRIDPRSPNSPSARALRTGEPVQVTDTRSDLLYANFAERAEREGYRYVLAIPLHTVHARPAALLIQKAEPYVASYSELELATAFGRYVTLAMENAALFAQTDKQLAEARRRLEAVVGSLDEGMVLTGLDRRVYYANAAAARIVGMSEEEMVGAEEGSVLAGLEGRSVSSVAPTDEVPLPTSPGDSGATREITVDMGGGRLRDLWASSFEVTDEHGEGIGRCHLWRDITPDRELHRAKEALLATVSHELKAPLANIKAYASTLLAEDVAWEADTEREFIQVIDSETDRLNSLVANLLDLSRIEGGMLELNAQEVDMAGLAEEVVASFPVEVRSRVEVDVGVDPCTVLGDRIRLGTVVRNLVENSARYAPESPVSVRVECSDGMVTVEVSDRGPGLPPGTEEAVFDRFTRLGEHLSQASGGVGLGLAISKGIVEAHGGSIRARRLPVGVSFEVCLPRPARTPGRDSAGATLGSRT